jgi:hypothetical protein
LNHEQRWPRRPPRHLSLRHLACAATCAVPLMAPFAAAAGTFHADYDISLAGIPIGVANVGAELEGERYKLDVRARLTGLVGVLVSGKGGATATGTLSGARVYPSTFALTSATSDSTRTLRMALVSGNVQQVEIAPPLPDWDKPDRVPVSEAHKRNIVDPLSAVLMPVSIKAEGTEAAACNRSIPVFDGVTRFNIVLAYVGAKSINTDSYRGPIVVCSVRYVPIAGHRPNRRVTKFMETNHDMEAWLAPVPGENVYVPYRISVKTLVGTTVIEASRFSGEGTATASAPGRPKRAGN